MSHEEKAYMLATGQPLTDTERTVAIDMHRERACRISNNIARLEAELRHQQDILDGENAVVRHINDDWKDLGPNTMLFISETERARIRKGLPTADLSITYATLDVIHPRFIPDETEAATASDR